MPRSHASSSVRFTEWMRGFASLGQTSPRAGFEDGQRDRTPLMFELTILINGVEQFVESDNHIAEARGYLEGPVVGGRCPVERGSVNLLVDSEGDSKRKKMLYRLFFTTANGDRMTLRGSKDLFDQVGLDVWADTTTLDVYLLRGHVEDPADDPRSEILGAGVLRIHVSDFLKQLTTFRAEGPDLSSRAAALASFGRFFLGKLWDTYGLTSILPAEAKFEREIPLYTTEGVPDAEVTVHPFSTGDKLGLSLLRFCRQPCEDVVLIVHGLTTSSDMFIMPEHRNLVTHLLDEGFSDVWTLDFRMSNRFPYNMFRHRDTMDDVALYDMPAAVATVRSRIGAGARIHVICHCLGSVSFMMALFGRTVTGIRSVIANSVALTPRVPAWSKVKLTIAPFAVEYLLGRPYLNPRWSQEPGLTIGKVFSKVNSWFHRECDVPACHMLSMLWGTGWPALYNHENLADITHRRGGDLYGPTSVHYYRHVRKMVRANSTAVKYRQNDPRHRALPDNYFEHAAHVMTPVLFMTGGENRVFTDSNIVCHERLEAIAPGRHQMHVFPGYGHQDVFMGKRVDRDIFPRLVQFLNEHRCAAS